MPAVGEWWGITRGSPRTGLMQDQGSEVVGRAPVTVQQLELRWRARSAEGAADAGRGRGQGG